MALHLLAQGRGQINFGFIIAVLLLVVLVITAATGILGILPSIKHEAKASALEPRAFVISSLLLENTGYPPDWTSANVERVGLLQYDSFKERAVLGRLNSTKITHASTLSYDTVAEQLGIGNETSFRVTISNAATLLDLYGSEPGGTSSVYVMRRVLALDDTGLVNVTVEVWE